MSRAALPRKPPLEVDPVQASAWIERGLPLFDVRPPSERQLGSIRGASACVSADPGQNASLPPADEPFLLYCAAGARSLAHAQRLREAGYGRVSSIRGGFQSWRALGLPVDYPEGLGAGETVRYARQIVLPEVGARGQARLARSRVLLVGAGGLGSPAALYLAGAGIGVLGVVDGDVVERSNLHRQILHDDLGVGRRKVDSARERLLALNPAIEVRCRAGRIDDGNALEWLDGWDLVIDGSDNAPTREAVNAACVHLGLPLVYGAVTAFEGQVSLFHPAAEPGNSPCYACVFPPGATPPAPDCATAGVLGVMPGLVGTLQALEALKWLLGAGRPLRGRLLLVDGLNAEFRRLELRANPSCPVCGPAARP